MSINKEVTIQRPEPMSLEEELVKFNRSMDIKTAIKEIVEGKTILIEDYYSSGLSLLHELTFYLKNKFKDKSFSDQRTFRSAYRKLSHRILVKISDTKLGVKKAPDIGWLRILYPDLESFMLPFPQVQGLNSSWQWYEKGLSVPVLRNKIHPYYGVYFPTRFEHLILFDNWLKRYQGAKKSAMDIGVGCGVLSFLLTKHGFQKVFATDSNPNAIVGMEQFMGDTKLSRKIELGHGHLFAKWEQKTELIVFNPPWLPTTEDMDDIEEAVYYKEDLFNDFFKEAKNHLLPEGKIVMLFSNLAQIAKISAHNPIEKEIESGGRFKLDFFLAKAVKKASPKTKRNQKRRSEEEVQLWVLEHK